jgi:hypothetical protein
MVNIEMLHYYWRIHEGRVVAMLLLTMIRRNLEGTMDPVTPSYSFQITKKL